MDGFDEGCITAVPVKAFAKRIELGGMSVRIVDGPDGDAENNPRVRTAVMIREATEERVARGVAAPVHSTSAADQKLAGIAAMIARRKAGLASTGGAATGSNVPQPSAPEHAYDVDDVVAHLLDVLEKTARASHVRPMLTTWGITEDDEDVRQQYAFTTRTSRRCAVGKEAPADSRGNKRARPAKGRRRTQKPVDNVAPVDVHADSNVHDVAETEAARHACTAIVVETVTGLASSRVPRLTVPVASDLTDDKANDGPHLDAVLAAVTSSSPREPATEQVVNVGTVGTGAPLSLPDAMGAFDATAAAGVPTLHPLDASEAEASRLGSIAGSVLDDAVASNDEGSRHPPLEPDIADLHDTRETCAEAIFVVRRSLLVLVDVLLRYCLFDHPAAPDDRDEAAWTNLAGRMFPEEPRSNNVDGTGEEQSGDAAAPTPELGASADTADSPTSARCVGELEKRGFRMTSVSGVIQATASLIIAYLTALPAAPPRATLAARVADRAPLAPTAKAALTPYEALRASLAPTPKYSKPSDWGRTHHFCLPPPPPPPPATPLQRLQLQLLGEVLPKPNLSAVSMTEADLEPLGYKCSLLHHAVHFIHAHGVMLLLCLGAQRACSGSVVPHVGDGMLGTQTMTPEQLASTMCAHAPRSARNAADAVALALRSLVASPSSL